MLPVEVIEMLKEFTLRHDGSRPVHQIFEDSVFRWREVQRLAVSLHGLFERIELDVGHLEDWSCCTLAAAYQRLDARNQLTKIKRLVEIVIRACVEQFDDGLCTFARSKN